MLEFGIEMKDIENQIWTIYFRTLFKVNSSRLNKLKCLAAGGLLLSARHFKTNKDHFPRADSKAMIFAFNSSRSRRISAQSFSRNSSNSRSSIASILFTSSRAHILARDSSSYSSKGSSCFKRSHRVESREPIISRYLQ